MGRGRLTNFSTQHPSPPFLRGAGGKFSASKAHHLLGCQLPKSRQRYQPHLYLFMLVLGSLEKLSYLPQVTQLERPSYLWTPGWAGTPGESSFPWLRELPPGGLTAGRDPGCGVVAGTLFKQVLTGGLGDSFLHRGSGCREMVPSSAEEEVKSGINGVWDRGSRLPFQ